MFVKINVLLVLIVLLQICELLIKQAEAIGVMRSTESVKQFKESGPSYSAPASGEKVELLETQDLSQYGPLALHGDNNLDPHAHRSRKRRQENRKEACPSCTTPKGGKHLSEDDMSANLYPNLDKISENSDTQIICPSHASLQDKNVNKRNDGSVCPTCLAPIARTENACPTGSPLDEQDVNSDIQRVSFSDPDANMNDGEDSLAQSGADQKVCPTCSTLIEAGLAVCPSCLVASTLERLKREAHFHQKRHLKPDHHKAQKRQNRNKPKYPRLPRHLRKHKPNVLKRKTVNDFNGNTADSLLDKDREDDLYQSFGRLLDKDDESGFAARSRIRTHRLTDHSDAIVKENADGDQDVNDAQDDEEAADEGDASS